MSDSDKSLEILISTKADLAGAKAAEAQLEQDITKAKELGEAYDDLDSRLKNGREATTENQTDAETTISPDASSDGERVSGSTKAAHSGQNDGHEENGTSPGANGNSQLGWIKAGLEAIRQTLGAMPTFFGAGKDAIAPSIGTQDKVRVGDRAAQFADKANITTAAPAFANVPGVRGAQTTQQPGVAGEEDYEQAVQIPEGYSQAIQSAGERIRTALEQNTQITVSALSRTLELIDQQNRKLGELDRRIAEIGGQIKSLKNL